jgi:DNA-binding XRE family transcriptional regulator
MVVSPLMSIRGVFHINKKNIYQLCVLYINSIYLCFIKQNTMKEIRELRKQKGITQEKLAYLSGVTTVTVNRAENSGKMRQSTYLKLVNTLNTLEDAVSMPSTNSL